MAGFLPSRKRELPGGDEEATTVLKLGEFQNVPTLTLSEARLLINAVIDHRKSSRQAGETENTIKTQDYLDVFARFKQKENIEAVERMLASKVELEFFERSQLGELLRFDCSHPERDSGVEADWMYRQSLPRKRR